MKKPVTIGLTIVLAGVVGYLLFTRSFVPLIFAISIAWFHEFGHFLSAKWLGHSPSAICVSFLVFPSAVFREDIDNKKHEKIVSASGPLGALFAFAIVTITFAPVSPSILVIGLAMALVSSIIDFMELFSLTGRRSDTDMLNIKIKSQRFSWLLVFSEERWSKLKARIEKQSGRKINFRKIVLG